MAGEREGTAVADGAAAVALAIATTKRQVLEIIETMPFDDDPAAFLRVLGELAQAHDVDGDE